MYRSAFNKDTFFSAATVAVVAGEAKKLGEYAVNSKEIISLGWGGLEGQENAQGRIYVQLKDNTEAGAVQIHGTVRLSVYSPQDRPIAIMHEFRTEQLDTSSTDRTKQIPFPEGMYEITEDNKIVMEFISDTSATLSKANSTIMMDIKRIQA
jgi:hypothetical protein